MTLLLTLLLIGLIALTAVTLLSPLTRRSGLETEWDDPVPDQYHQAWSARHQAGQAQPG